MCCVERLLYMSAAPSMLSVHLVTPTERANFLEARAQRWTTLSGRPLLVLLSSLFLYCFSFFFPTIQAAATGNQSFRDPQQVELSLPVSLSLTPCWSAFIRHIKGQLRMLLCPRFAGPSWLILPPIRKQSPLRCTDSSNQCRGLWLSEFLWLLWGAKGLWGRKSLSREWLHTETPTASEPTRRKITSL